MKRWVLTSIAGAALLCGLSGFTGSVQQPARYGISHLPELSQFKGFSVVALDDRGDLLANVWRLIRIHGRLINDAHAVLDLNPGTKSARVIALRPLHGTLESYAIGMNSSGAILLQASINRWIPFVGRLRDGTIHWDRLYFVPDYGSGSVVGIADNGVVAGEIHGLIRKPHCCTSLQQAVMWAPSASGSYHSPTFLTPADSEATAIWSAGQTGQTVISGIVDPNLSIWTIPQAGCASRNACPVPKPVIGQRVGPIYSGNEAITSLTGWNKSVYGAGELLNCCGSPHGVGQWMRFGESTNGRVAPSTFRDVAAPSKYSGKLCVSGPWSLRAEQGGVLTGVGGAGCSLKPCTSAQTPCMYPPLTVALIWQSGRAQVLENFIPTHTRWWLKDAEAISARGEIAGTAWFGRRTVPFLLSPNTSP